MKVRYYSLLLFFFSFLLLYPLGSQAAVLQWENQNTVIAQNQLFLLDLYVNTELENINAIEGTVTISGSSLGLEKIVDSNSLISNWVEYPRINGNSIKFSGIIPGGYRGKHGLVFSILCRGMAAGATSLQLNDMRILRNDGQGTAVAVQAQPLTIEVSGNIIQSPAQSEVFTDDTEAPEPFTIELARHPEVYDNRWFIAFGTQDKLSGIEHYEIQETSDDKPDPNAWKQVISPYVLSDQSLQSSIFVRAFDNAHNARLTTLKPTAAAKPYDRYQLYSILIAVIVFFVFLWSRRRRK